MGITRAFFAFYLRDPLIFIYFPGIIIHLYIYNYKIWVGLKRQRSRALTFNFFLIKKD
jgi:hypothetical protein